MSATNSMMYIMYENTQNVVKEYYDVGLMTRYFYMVNNPDYGKKWIDESVNTFKAFKFNYDIKKQFYPFYRLGKIFNCVGCDTTRNTFFYEKESDAPSCLFLSEFDKEAGMYRFHIPFRKSELKKLTEDDKKVLQKFTDLEPYFRLHSLQAYNIYEDECNFVDRAVISFNRNHDVLIGSFNELENLPKWVSRISKAEYVKRMIM